MKQIASGSDTGLDFGTWMAVPLDGVSATWINNEAYARRIRINVWMADSSTPTVAGNKISFRVKRGTAVNFKIIGNMSGDFTPTTLVERKFQWQSLDIMFAASERMSIEFMSDENGGADADIDIETSVFDMDDISSLGGQRVTLSSNRLDVNTETVLNANPVAIADILQKILDALDTAVPSSPTANSINERIKTIDDEFECDWYIDTGQDPYEIVYHASGDTGTEYFRKKMYQLDGTPISNLAQIPLLGKVIAV